MPEVCSAFQMVVNNFARANVFSCELPSRPVSQIDMGSSPGMNTEMRWRGVVWPTENVEACTAQAGRILEVRDIKAGETIKEDGFKCVDAKTGATEIDFSVLRSCAADKDPNAVGSCTSEVIVKPKAAAANAQSKPD